MIDAQHSLMNWPKLMMTCSGASSTLRDLVTDNSKHFEFACEFHIFSLIGKSCSVEGCRPKVFSLFLLPSPMVPAGSPSHGGDVTVYVKDINQPNFPTPFYSVFLSISVFMALSTVFHSIILPTTLRCLSLFYWCLIGPFNYISLYVSLPQLLYNLFCV